MEVIRLFKNYRYDIGLTHAETQELIEKRGKESDLYVKTFNRQIIIRKPWLIFNIMPVNFQVSFVARLISNTNGTTIVGTIGAPRLFYQICISAYALMSICYFAVVVMEHGFKIYAVLNPLLFGISGVVMVIIYIGFGKVIFHKQSKIVLRFFEEIVLDYPL